MPMSVESGVSGSLVLFSVWNNDCCITRLPAITSRIPASRCRWWIAFNASPPGSLAAAIAAFNTAFRMSPPLTS